MNGLEGIGVADLPPARGVERRPKRHLDPLAQVLPSRTKVQVGVHRKKVHDPDATHHIIVPHERDGWRSLCSDKQAARSFLGYLETAVTCNRCAAVHRSLKGTDKEGSS